MQSPDLQALIELSEKATPGEWRYRCKSNSWHLAPDPYTAFQYGESIMDPEDDWDSLKFEDIEFVQALVKWFRANESTLANLTAPTLPGAGGGDDISAVIARIQAAFNALRAPESMTELRKEYWKAGARAAIRAASAALPPQQGG